MLLFAIPLSWSLVGGSAAILLEVPQDYGLIMSVAVILKVVLPLTRRRRRARYTIPMPPRPICRSIRKWPTGQPVSKRGAGSSAVGSYGSFAGYRPSFFPAPLMTMLASKFHAA